MRRVAAAFLASGVLFAWGCSRDGVSLPTDGAPENPSGTATAAPSPTPNPNGGYGLPLTIPGEHIDGDLHGFPVWIDIEVPELRHTGLGGHVLDPEGEDLVLLSGAAVLPFERMAYDADRGRLAGWVRLDMLFEQSDHVFYLYYGETSLLGLQATAASEAVWSNGFAASWHLEDVGTNDGGTVWDSTSNWVDGEDFSAAPAVPGVVGRAASFGDDLDVIRVSEADERIRDGGLNAGRDNFTISAWFRRSAATGGWDTIFEKGVFVEPDGWGFYVERQNGPESLALYLCDGFGNQSRTQTFFSPNDDQWYQLVATVNRDTTEVRFFVNGEFEGDDLISFNVANDSVDTPSYSTIGQNTGTDSCCSVRGNLDEITIADGVRSSAWIKTAYRNQAAPAAFVVPGVEISF